MISSIEISGRRKATGYITWNGDEWNLIEKIFRGDSFFISSIVNETGVQTYLSSSYFALTFFHESSEFSF